MTNRKRVCNKIARDGESRATCDATHREQTDAGKHLLCRKDRYSNYTTRRALRQLAERAGAQRLTVSAREHSADSRACQTTAANRILSPMIMTAKRNKWTRVLDTLLDLFAKWTQSV